MMTLLTRLFVCCICFVKMTPTWRKSLRYLRRMPLLLLIPFQSKLVEPLFSTAEKAPPKTRLKCSKVFLKLTPAADAWQTASFTADLCQRAFHLFIGHTDHHLRSSPLSLRIAANWIAFFSQLCEVLSVDAIGLNASTAHCLQKLASGVFSIRMNAQLHIAQLLSMFHAHKKDDEAAVSKHMEACCSSSQHKLGTLHSTIHHTLSELKAPNPSMHAEVNRLHGLIVAELERVHVLVRHLASCAGITADLGKLHRNVCLSSSFWLDLCTDQSRLEELKELALNPIDKVRQDLQKYAAAAPNHAHNLLESIQHHPLEHLSHMVTRPRWYCTMLHTITHLVPAELLRASVSRTASSVQALTVPVLKRFPHFDEQFSAAANILARVAGAENHLKQLPTLEDLTAALLNKSCEQPARTTNLKRVLMAYSLQVLGLDSNNLPGSKAVKKAIQELSKQFGIDVTQRKGTFRHLLFLCDDVDVSTAPLPMFLQRIGRAQLYGLCTWAECPLQHQFHHLFDSGTKWDVLKDIECS